MNACMNEVSGGLSGERMKHRLLAHQKLEFFHPFNWNLETTLQTGGVMSSILLMGKTEVEREQGTLPRSCSWKEARAGTGTLT